MKINKIKIKNFYSFVKSELNFSEYEGLTLIKGINKDNFGSNGSGKSALLEAIFFSLTGKTVRKSTEAAIINNKSKKGCYVEIELNDGIVIKRSKKPTKLELWVDGTNQTKEHASATQSYIDELLNTNYKILLSSMFFGQSNNLNFLDADSNDKRMILRNFLNLEELFTLRDRIKLHKSNFWQELKVQDYIINEREKEKSKLTDILAKINKRGKEYYDAYSPYLDLSLEEILENEKQIRGLERGRDKLNLQIATIQKEKDKLLSQDVNSRCGTCQQEFPDYYWDNHELRISKLEEDIKHLKGGLNSIDTVEPLPISSSEYSSVVELKDILSKKDLYSSQIREITDDISDAQNKKIKFNKRYEIMRFWEKAFSEQGIIKYIIRNILSHFNDRINYYLSFLTNQGYYLEFDEELSEKILISDSLVHYISLSGGEKRKINLAVLLALRDLLSFTDKNQLDLIFFDEVTENLDEEGVLGLFNLLKEIKKTKNIFVITHNKHLKTLLDSAPRLTIMKHRGESVILERNTHGNSKS